MALSKIRPGAYFPKSISLLQSCKGVGLSTCPLNYECMNAVCCRHDATNRCPNGGLGGSYCLEPGQCGAGYECVRGTCCFLARCPDGQLPAQPCGPSGQCGLGFFCIQGQCITCFEISLTELWPGHTFSRGGPSYIQAPLAGPGM